MPGGLTRLEQADFSAGMFRWPRHLIPPKGVYDAADGILTDDGSLLERGGAAFKSNSNTRPVNRIWDGFMKWRAKNLTVFTTSTDALVYELDPADDATPTNVGSIAAPSHALGMVQVGGVLFVTPRTLYAGSTAADYQVGTVDITSLSSTVVGHGTTFTGGDVVPGTLIASTDDLNQVAVVKSVTDATHLELATPWPFATRTGTNYRAKRVVNLTNWYQLDAAGLPGGLEYVAAVGTPPRLVVARGSDIMFSEPDDPFNIHATSRHSLPGGAIVLGMQGLGDTLLVFSSHGVFAIYNMNLDLTDQFGNPQQRLSQVSDAQIWSTRGCSFVPWESGVIVPCMDDIYLFDTGGRQVKLSESITSLYRTYSGVYYPGPATVFKGHYILPIFSGTDSWAATLVCRLDRKAWTRWYGDGGSALAVARRDGTATGSAPLLLGGVHVANDATYHKVADLSTLFTPSGSPKTDPDGTYPQLDVIGRDVELGSNNPHNQVKQVRVTYELADAASDNPTLLAYVAADAPSAGFTQLTSPSTAAPESDGGSPFTWVANKSGRRLRWRLKKGAQPTSGLTLRRVELFVRQSGKQV